MIDPHGLHATTNFPGYAWAWPSGDRHLLLQAVGLPDPERAAAALKAWAARRDFDDVVYAEQRLLIALADEESGILKSSAERARIAGITRRLWTRSRLALHTARSGLVALQDAEIDTMVIKGAAFAVDLDAVRARTVNDVDIVVRPDQFQRAGEALFEHGWRAQDPRLWERYLGGGFGLPALGIHKDYKCVIDLHQNAYHHQPAPDDAVWRRSVPARLLGVPINLPSPADRLALTIVHGAIGGHRQSDWMIDCVRIVERGDVDWSVFEIVCTALEIDAIAAIALTYIALELQAPVPRDALRRIADAGLHPRRLLWEAALLSRPKKTLSPLARAGRTFVRLLRFARGDRWFGLHATRPASRRAPQTPPGDPG